MKYIIWNKIDDVYTPSGNIYTADEWKDLYKWTKRPEVKVVMAGGVINGALIAEYDSFKQRYIDDGAAINDSMTDEEVLAACEAWDNRVIEKTPSAEERIAAALEYQNLTSMEDVK